MQAKYHNKSNHHIKPNNSINSTNESAHGKTLNPKILYKDETEFPRTFLRTRLQPVVRECFPTSIRALPRHTHTCKKEWPTQVNICNAVTRGSILPPHMTATQQLSDGNHNRGGGWHGANMVQTCTGARLQPCTAGYDASTHMSWRCCNMGMMHAPTCPHEQQHNKDGWSPRPTKWQTRCAVTRPVTHLANL